MKFRVFQQSDEKFDDCIVRRVKWRVCHQYHCKHFFCCHTLFVTVPSTSVEREHTPTPSTVNSRLRSSLPEHFQRSPRPTVPKPFKHRARTPLSRDAAASRCRTMWTSTAPLCRQSSASHQTANLLLMANHASHHCPLPTPRNELNDTLTRIKQLYQRCRGRCHSRLRHN